MILLGIYVLITIVLFFLIIFGDLEVENTNEIIVSILIMLWPLVVFLSLIYVLAAYTIPFNLWRKLKKNEQQIFDDFKFGK